MTKRIFKRGKLSRKNIDHACCSKTKFVWWYDHYLPVRSEHISTGGKTLKVGYKVRALEAATKSVMGVFVSTDVFPENHMPLIVQVG